MRALSRLDAHEAKALEGVVFDLDGTLLTKGRLTPVAYDALHQMADAGLTLVVCTGRPAAWGEVAQRQWPVKLTVTENGAIAYKREGLAVERLDRLATDARGRRRAQLMTLVERVRKEFPALTFADDNLGRLSDVTFDIGERTKVPPDIVAAVRAFVASHDGRTFESSIHLHVTLDRDDKASGTVAVLSRELGCDATAALRRFAYVGDSRNDEAGFAAFRLTFGVDNIRAHVGQMSVGPRFVSHGAEGAGFAEIAQQLLALRAGLPA